MTIGYECGDQTVFGQLSPKRIVVPGNLQRDAVAEVGGKPSACFYSLMDLVRRSMRVADGDVDSTLAKARNVGRRIVVMWRDCD